MAISIQNTVHVFHNKVWKDREQTYLDTMRKYTEEEQTKLCEMMGMLVDTQEEILRILGMDSLTFKSCALIMQDQYGLFCRPKRTSASQY